MRTLARLIHDRSGASAIELALVIVLISLAALVAMQSIGSQVESTFANTSQTIKEAKQGK